MRVWQTMAAGALALVAAGAAAQPLLEAAATLGKKPDPVVIDFAVAAAGSYRITITDFDTTTGPLRMARLNATVLRGAELLRSASVTSASATGVATATFAATPGTHRLVLIGQPAANATVGSAGLRIDDPVSGTVLHESLHTFRVAPPPLVSPADVELELAVAAGSYTLTTADFALPQSLAVLHTTVIRRSDSALLANSVPAGTPIALSAASADTFEIFVHAELAASAKHGVGGVALRDAASVVVHHEIVELGDWPYRFDFDVAAPLTLTATLGDLQFPAPLAQLAGQVVRAGSAAGSRLVPGVGTTFAAVPGSYTLYVHAVESAGAGSFGVDVRPAGGAVVLERVQSVVPAAPTTDVSSIERSFDVATAGDYTLTLTDFGASGFFDAFTSVSLALTRDNQIVRSLSAAGSFTFAATPGRYGIAIVADPFGTSGEGLLGVRVRGPGDAVAYDRTEAVGTDFLTFDVEATAAQSIDVRLTDLAFPAAFAQIRAAVTRGGERVGEIVGAGVFSFQATPGTYIVTLLASPSPAVGYGTFGVRASTTPPVPVVSLSASADSTTVGGSVTLTWSAQNADTCTASGGWTGSRGTAGSAASGALQANTSFALTCLGPGGSRNATVAVTVTAAQRSSGGGASDLWLLALLGGAALVHHRRRTLAPSG